MKHYQIEIMSVSGFSCRALDAKQAEAAARTFILGKTKAGNPPPFLLSITELKDPEADNVDPTTAT